MSDNKKKPPKGCLVYSLEIIYNHKDDTVEHICESIDGDGFRGPMDMSWEYLEEYFDEEDLQMMDSLYDVGES